MTMAEYPTITEAYPPDAPEPIVALHYGDCLDALRSMLDNSVHCVVTDPPYGLSDLKPAAVVTAMTAWANGDRDHVPDARGFMSRAWDAFVPPPAVWDECLRVLKPGGHLAAFAGSRTQDLMGLSIRMAGFEIRDGLQWIYGSGMPKGLDVGKAIDKTRDDRDARAALGAWLRGQREAAGLVAKQVAVHWPSATGGLTGCVANWELGLNLPTVEQWAKLREVIGFGADMDAEHARLSARQGTWGNERADRTVTAFARDTYGEGATVEHAGTPVLDAARQWQGWNTSLKPSVEPIILARKPITGTVAGNVLEHGTGAMNIDATRTAGPPSVGGSSTNTALGLINDDGWQPKERAIDRSMSSGRWPANVLLSEEAAAELDGQSGTLTSGANPTRRSSDKFRDAYGEFTGQSECTPARGADSGGASRFFPTFKYQAKAAKRERPTIDGKGWPTVKPLALMTWLVRLLTPEGGTVLDPFAGSGSTLQAARDAGFNAVGIERDRMAYRLTHVRLGWDDPGDAGPVADPEDVDTLPVEPPEPRSIFDAGCDVHGPHPGTVTCMDCLVEVQTIIGKVLAVLYDERFAALPDQLEEHALLAETVAEAQRVREEVRAALIALRGTRNDNHVD